jgi:hypothetical protein
MRLIDPWTVPTTQPVLGPNNNTKVGKVFAHACPTWGRITSDMAYGKISENLPEIDPAKIAAREAVNALRHAEAVQREEAAKDARAVANAAMKALNKQLRAERSEARRALRDAEQAKIRKRAPFTEERKARISAAVRAAWALRRVGGAPWTDYRVSHHAPRKSENKIAPEGMVIGRQAARTVGCANATVSNYIISGRLKCERKGKYTYVRVEELRALLTRTGTARKEERADLRAAKLAKSVAKLTPKPWPKLIKRRTAAEMARA